MRQAIGAAVLAMGLAATPAHAADRAGFSPLAAMPVGADLRLHVLAIEAAPASVDTSSLRKGFGGSMIDYFPLGNDGFHISAGTRMTSRNAYINSSQDERLSQLLFSSSRFGRRFSGRATPAMTVGWSKEVEKGLTFGLEAGAMKGHLDRGYYGAMHPMRYRLGGGGRPTNELARMTVAFRF